ncbi:MAG: hypothetical protein K6U00_13085, partial [Armatimonadetes bacterium]|nr:hypothetical protein [Armatimonadota bacterium]
LVLFFVLIPAFRRQYHKFQENWIYSHKLEDRIAMAFMIVAEALHKAGVEGIQAGRSYCLSTKGFCDDNRYWYRYYRNR